MTTVLNKYIPGKIPLTEDKVQAYLIDLRLFNEDEMRDCLSTDEIERADRLKMKDKRRQFSISRALLRQLLSMCLVDTAPASVYFNYGEHGKPIVNHTHMGKPIVFNLSHSDDYVLIGITLVNSLGVDIEAIKTTADITGLVKRYFSKTEIAAWEALPKDDKNEAFYRCWTRKEAFIKADGRGVSLGLDKFSVSLEDKANAAAITFDSEANIKGNWYSYQPVTVPGFQTAIVSNTDKLHVTSHVISN